MKAFCCVLAVCLGTSLHALTPEAFGQRLAEIVRSENTRTPDGAIGGYRGLLATEGLTGDQQARVYHRLATFAAASRRQDVLDEALGALQALPDSPGKTGALLSVIRDFGVRRMPALAKKLFMENAARFNDDQKTTLYGALADGAAYTGDQATFEEAAAFILAQPLAKRIAATGRLAQHIADDDFARGVKVLRDALATPAITPEQQVGVLHELLRLTINKSSPFDYDAIRAIKAELDTRIGAGEVSAASASAAIATFGSEAAMRVCDFPAARAAFEQALALNPNNSAIAFQAAEMALLFRDREAAARHLDHVIAANPDNPDKDAHDAANARAASTRYQAAVLRALDAGQPIADADAAFAGSPFTSAQRMNLLRDASTRLLRARRYDEVRLIHDEVDTMFTPTPEKVFTVRYAPGIPRSAGAWETSPLLKEEAYRETRFERETAIYKRPASEAARLKDAPADPQATVPDGYETTAYLAYDEHGLHVYVKARNPDARQIDLGLLPGGSIEMFLQPGDGQPYHWLLYSLPGTDDKYAAFMATASKHYRYTYDHIAKQTVVTPDGIGAYTFFPWMLCYDSLPVAGNSWKLGIHRSDKAGDTGIRVGFGGHVHELGRGLTLQFDFPPDRLGAIKRTIALRAFAGYRAIRNDRGGFLAEFNDPELGDPAFYAAELDSFLKELDTAGERLLAEPAPGAGDIDTIFETYVPLWAEIKYIVADKRTAYLKRALLNE